MFTLHFPNVFCAAEGRAFPSLEAAIEAGKRIGFEFVVASRGATLASWSPIGGLRRHGPYAEAL